MKLLLLLVVSCLALRNGKGAPSKAVYKFLRCNPEGDQANCVTQQSPEMAWSPDLPAKLPASSAQYLEAEPVEDESPLREEEDEEADEDEEVEVEEEEEEDEEEEGESMMSEKGESPVSFSRDDGSGGYEGSAAGEIFVAEQALTLDGETGSGESWTEKNTAFYKGEETRGMRRLFPSRSVVGEAKPEKQELKEDYLLQL